MVVKRNGGKELKRPRQELNLRSRTSEARALSTELRGLKQNYTMLVNSSRSWDMAQHPPMPRPQNDDGYFEEMSKVVFRAGLNWRVIVMFLFGVGEEMPQTLQKMRESTH